MNAEWIRVSKKVTGLGNKDPVRAGVYWECTEISYGIKFTITQHSN